MSGFEIQALRVAKGIGGFWVNDQPAIQLGAEADGFFFKGAPVSPGFKAIREPSEALCIILQLGDGQLAYGDCVTVLNLGYGDRPAPLRADSLEKVQSALQAAYVGKTFPGFRESARLLDDLTLDKETLRPVAYGMSQALLSATALARKKLMTSVLQAEYHIDGPLKRPELAGSCGGNWQQNVEKAILREVSMFPQSAIQTRRQCEDLPAFVEWIIKRIGDLGADGYIPDLHFDFHSALGRMFDNDEDKVCDYLGKIVDTAGPYQVYFEDPLFSQSPEEAMERMARLRDRLDTRGPNCKLIADEWVNSPGHVEPFAKAKAAHAFQIKAPDNGSLINTISAIQACKAHGVLPYLGGSCNETEISVRATLHVGMATGAWRMLTRPGLGFDEGVMIATNEFSRISTLLDQ
ncbi:methylaspartate ammonia-lyase [Achromobacter aloeverae]